MLVQKLWEIEMEKKVASTREPKYLLRPQVQGVVVSSRERLSLCELWEAGVSAKAGHSKIKEWRFFLQPGMRGQGKQQEI